MFCTRLANGGLFPTGDHIVPFVISPRFECLNKRTHTHTHCTHGTYGVLHCLLFCDQTRPNLTISLVGYHCAIEFPCGVLLFYCCKYPTIYGVRVHPCRQINEQTAGESTLLFSVQIDPPKLFVCQFWKDGITVEHNIAMYSVGCIPTRNHYIHRWQVECRGRAV